MLRFASVLLVGVVVAAGCGGSANVDQERSALLALDREWSQTTKDLDKFVSYFADDASIYLSGSPIVTGTTAIRDAMGKMMSAPGFSLEWTASKADVGGAGDIGYTTGAYQFSANGATENGKYVTVWKKQADGQWKVIEDIGNADAEPQFSAAQHTVIPPAKVTWGDAPPNLPPGAKLAVISGDPAKPGPFVLRLQLPARYTVAAHWHPTAESVTVLSGTLALGMGEKFDPSALQDLAAGGYAMVPAEMRHFVMTRAATTLQIGSMGPFVINYVNPADDPSGQPK